MKNFWLSVLSTLVAGAVVGQFVLSVRTEARLARIELTLEMLTQKHASNLANK